MLCNNSFSPPTCQVFAWAILPNIEAVEGTNRKDFLWLILVFQHISRVCLLFPLSSQILEGAGVVSKKAWTGAAYNLLVFMLTGHVSTSFWWLMPVSLRFKIIFNLLNYFNLSRLQELGGTFYQWKDKKIAGKWPAILRIHNVKLDFLIAVQLKIIRELSGSSQAMLQVNVIQIITCFHLVYTVMQWHIMFKVQHSWGNTFTVCGGV